MESRTEAYSSSLSREDGGPPLRKSEDHPHTNRQAGLFANHIQPPQHTTSTEDDVSLNEVSVKFRFGLLEGLLD